MVDMKSFERFTSLLAPMNKNLKTTERCLHVADEGAQAEVANLQKIVTFSLRWGIEREWTVQKIEKTGSPGKTRTCDIWINSPPFQP